VSSASVSTFDTVPNLEQTNKVLLAQVRHELRAPAHAIIGYSEMLLDDAANLTDQHFFADLHQVHSLGKQILWQINTLLDGSHVDYEGRKLNLSALGATVRRQLRIPVSQVIDACDSLLTHADQMGFTDFQPELHRVRAAGLSLFALNDELLDFGKRGPAPWVDESAPIVADQAHVLIVDDNALDRDILARCLYGQGYHFTLAQSGPQALELAASHAFELILLDILMPEMNGSQVIEKLKADPKLRQVPVLALGAVDESDTVVRCLQLGADDYLFKPFHPALLQTRISACLERKRLRERDRLHYDQLKAEQERYNLLLQLLLLVCCRR
jgi:sigma-B regulation protein RsbU (phosphoserine phosphatase)